LTAAFGQILADVHVKWQCVMIWYV